jgi:alpha-L-rhamnosidase
MLGQIVEWFYHDLVGLAPDPAMPGFKRVIIRPQPVDGVDWARARCKSPRGPVAVSWKKASGYFLLRAEIPANTQAELWLPAKNEDQVEESGEAAAKRPGVHFERLEKGYAIFSLESGNFDFAVQP